MFIFAEIRNLITEMKTNICFLSFLLLLSSCTPKGQLKSDESCSNEEIQTPYDTLEINKTLKEVFKRDVTIANYDSEVLQYKNYKFFYAFEMKICLLIPEGFKRITDPDNQMVIFTNKEKMVLIIKTYYNEGETLPERVKEYKQEWAADNKISYDKETINDDYAELEGTIGNDDGKLGFCRKLVSYNNEYDKTLLFEYQIKDKIQAEKYIDTIVKLYPALPF